MCPWWNRPYREQLKEKAGEVAQQLARVTREVSVRVAGSGLLRNKGKKKRLKQMKEKKEGLLAMASEEWQGKQGGGGGGAGQLAALTAVSGLACFWI